MSSSIPTTQKAYVIKGNKATFEDVPVPKLNPGEILVKVKSVAINPTDVKHIDNQLAKDGAVVGMDLSGEVVAVSDEGEIDFKVGDQVFALVNGASAIKPDVGAFTEYAKVRSNIAIKAPYKLGHAKGNFVPLGPVTTWEAAASLPCSLITVLVAFEYYANIPLSKPHQPQYADQYFLVWGASSGLGQIAIQFGKRAGFKVIATASKYNFDILKSLGAEKVFDYHEEDVLEQISKYAGDNITLAFDTISVPPTTQEVYTLLSKNKDSTLLTSLEWDQSTVKEVNPHVTSKTPYAYLVLDKEKKFGVNGDVIKSPEGLIESGIKAVKELNELWAKDHHLFRHIPVEIVHGGFDGLEQALDIVRQGKYSGVKIAVSL